MSKNKKTTEEKQKEIAELEEMLKNLVARKQRLERMIYLSMQLEGEGIAEKRAEREKELRTVVFHLEVVEDTLKRLN